MAKKKKKVTVEIKVGGDLLGDLDKLKTKKGFEETADHTIYLKSVSELVSILSDKKVSLMSFIAQHTNDDVSSISISLNRKKEAVSRDLHELAAVGLVELTKKGRHVYPKVTADYLKIPIRHS